MSVFVPLWTSSNAFETFFFRLKVSSLFLLFSSKLCSPPFLKFKASFVLPRWEDLDYTQIPSLRLQGCFSQREQRPFVCFSVPCAVCCRASLDPNWSSHKPQLLDLDPCKPLTHIHAPDLSTVSLNGSHRSISETLGGPCVRKVSPCAVPVEPKQGIARRKAYSLRACHQSQGT